MALALLPVLRMLTGSDTELVGNYRKWHSEAGSSPKMFPKGRKITRKCCKVAGSWPALLLQGLKLTGKNGQKMLLSTRKLFLKGRKLTRNFYICIGKLTICHLMAGSSPKMFPKGPKLPENVLQSSRKLTCIVNSRPEVNRKCYSLAKNCHQEVVTKRPEVNQKFLSASECWPYVT